MTVHAHELPGASLPDAICPDIEVLVHRRATELLRERPRRRFAALSGVGGIAVAAACAVLFLVIGSPSGNGLISPRQAVAAVVQTLEGNGILYWVRRGDLIDVRDPQERRGVLEEQSWADLSSGDSHTVLRAYPANGAPQRPLESWVASGRQWAAANADGNGIPRLHRAPRRPAGAPPVSLPDDLRAVLARAEQGKAEIAEAGEADSVPLVKVTDRWKDMTLRVWVTREAVPRVARVETTIVTPNAQQPIVNTITTVAWRILPRTPEVLADVELPSTAKRVP